MRTQVAAWFDGIKQEPHAFRNPRFAIGRGLSNRVYLYAPERRRGHAVNFGLDSRHWDKRGDGGDYLIHVVDAGTYVVELTLGKGHQQGQVSFALKLNGQTLLAAQVSPDHRHLGQLTLPAGDHTLTLVRTDDGTGILERLVSLEFTEP